MWVIVRQPACKRSSHDITRMMHMQPTQADKFAEGPKVGQRGERCQRQGQGKSLSGEVEEGNCDLEETYDALTAAKLQLQAAL